MRKIHKPKIVRNKNKHCLEWKKTRLSIEVRENLKDKFKEAVEENGDTMKNVLVDYMEYYIKETLKRRNRAQ